MHLRFAFVLPLLALAPALHAREAQVSRTAEPAKAQAQALTLERVFASPSLNGPVPRGVKLSPDGRYLTVLRGRADDRERYQTTFAQTPGSVAAPTAGLHFTPGLLEQCRQRGVDRAEVTLHVGLGIFRAVGVTGLVGG